MKQTYKTVDYDWLIRPTGDIFSDVGGFVIKHLAEKYPEKDILELIEYMAKIYVNRWGNKIYSFFLNAPITQPAFKGEKKIEETIRYFNSLLNESAYSETGFCRITGRETRLFKAGRDNSLLSGSGTFVNFHHNFQFGLMLSKEMIIRMFFIPYGSVLVGNNIGIIQTNNMEVNEFFVKENCLANDAKIGKGLSDGILRSEYSIPSNALFRFVDNLLVDRYNRIKNLSISLYHFTNFGASPEIVIYRLPSSVFRFYSTCRARLNAYWEPFVAAHYTNSRYKGAVYDQSSSRYEFTKKGETEYISAGDYKLWWNAVLENLLKGNSLLTLFLKWVKKHTFNFSIVELYQKEIRNMKKETLDKIKELASFITEMDEDMIKKNIRALNGAKNPYELRRFFLNKVIVKNYNDGAEKPVITLDEMVNYLLPDSISWKEIRDLLLIAVYQQLHEKNKNLDLDLPEEEVVETEEN